jgi:hypothetical protein
MATYDQHYDNASAADSRLARRLSLDWSALFGGSLIGWGAMLVFSMIGMIVGVSVLDPFGARPAVSNSGAAIWGACCAIVASFIGAYLVVRLAGDRRRRESLLHSAVAWGMSLLLAGFIALWASGAAALSRTPARNTALNRARGTVALIETTNNGSLVALLATCGALLALGASMVGALAAASRISGIPLAEELGFRRGVNGHRKEMMAPESRRDETTILPPTH